MVTFSSTASEIQFDDNVKVLYTFSFDEMMSDVANKKIFWEQMKNI